MAISENAEQTPAAGSRGRSLQDELASLRIERKVGRAATAPRSRVERPREPMPDPAPARITSESRPRPARRRPLNLGLRLLSLLIWLIPLGLLGGIGYFAYAQYMQAKPKLSVKVAPVRALTQGEASTVLTAKGYIRSFQQAKLGAKVPGRIAEVRVKENQHVRQGDVLAELEHLDMDKQLETRKRMLERNRAEYREIEVDVHFKELKAYRAARLRAQNQSSDEEAEQAQSAYEIARRKLDTLQASLDYQQAMIDELVESIEEMKIKAPFDGTVLEKGAEKGETIVLGGLGAASGRGSVVTLADMNDLEVETDIAENMLGRLLDPKSHPREQRAEIQVSAFPDRRFHGYLDRVVPLGDRARGTVKVYVKVEERDTPLFPELVANVSFLPPSSGASAGPATTALYVPRNAVVDEADGVGRVWVVNNDNAAISKKVQFAVDSDRARIDEGLKAGETVIVSPPAGLVDGQVISIAD